MRRVLAAFAVASCLAAGQAVQLSPGELIYTVSDYRPEITFRSNASLVQVEAVVRKGWQPPLDGLTQDDFEIRDDGVPQRITAFEVLRNAVGAASAGSNGAAASASVAAKPRYVMFFMDDIDTGIYGINDARRGALDYLKASLPANQWIAVATSSGIVTQPFTQDRGLIEAALKRVMPHPIGCSSTATTRAYYAIHNIRLPVLRAGQQDSATANHCLPPGLGRADLNLASGESQARAAYDAISEQLQFLARQPGERVFLFASYGIFSADTAVFGGTIEHIADLAVRNHITINSLDTQGVGELLVTAQDLDALSDLSSDTGGQLFFGNNAFDVGVRELVEPPAVAYLLSFAPTPLK